MKRQIITALFAIILASCSQVPTPIPTSESIVTVSNTPQVTATVIPTFIPTSTEEFVSATPALIRELSARIAYIALGSPDVIGILDQANKQTSLVENCFFCNSLAWSSDGKWIAFNASFRIGDTGQIYAVNTENRDLKKITSDPHGKRDISWSPDGQKLLYAQEHVVDEKNTADVVVTSVDGTLIKKITYTPGYESMPTWSPDGTAIAFLYSETRLLEHWELWIMDPDGKNRRKVTNKQISHNTISWSPDGEEILFVSLGDCGKLYSARIDGSNLRQIVDYPGCIENPVWSPDGGYIMFIGSKSKTSLPSSPSWEIYIFSADSGVISELATDINGRPIIAIWDRATK